MRLKIIIALCIVCCKTYFSQDTKTTGFKIDTVYIAKLLQDADSNKYKNFTTFYQKSKEAAKQAKKINFLKGLFTAQKNLIDYYSNDGMLDSASLILNELQLCAKKLNTKKCFAQYNLSKANIFQQLSKTDSSLIYYIKSLKLYEEIKDTGNIVRCNYFLYLNYVSIDSVKAEKYLDFAIANTKKLANQSNLPTLLCNKGKYVIKRNFDSGYYYFNLAISQSAKYNNVLRKSMIYYEIGDYFSKNKKFDSSLKYFQTSFQLLNQSNFTSKAIYIESLIAKNLFDLNQIDKAEPLALKVFNYYINANVDLEVLPSIASVLSKIYESKNDYKKALYYTKINMQYKDTLLDIENKKGLLDVSTKYETEKKEAQITLLSEQNKLSISENNKQRIVVISSLLIALLFLGGLLIFVNRNSVKRKANAELNAQKQKIEQANNELSKRNKHIQDSIDYASVIQKSILTNEKTLSNTIKNYFVIYKPKEAVGGDFYWFYKLPNTNSYYIALADCTGHGVPGSLMTLLCTSIFNQVIEQQPNIQPAELLTTVNTKLYHSFNTKNNEKRITEGMDVTLLLINQNTKIVTYTGARNPIVLLNNNAQVTELPVNRYTVGTQPNYVFTEHSVQLNLNDTLYLFTDGFVDQKGGEKNLKLLKINFIKLLQTICIKDTVYQKKYLEEYFDNWKSSKEQIDDVSVIGIKI